MRIGFDAKRITNNATGLGNYSRYIVNSCAEFYPKDEYYLYSPGKGNDMLRERIIKDHLIKFRYPQTFMGQNFKSWWRSYGITYDMCKDNIDLFHGLSNEIPLNMNKYGIPSIVTIHDLIFLRYPECYKKLDRMIYTYKYGASARQAQHIIAVSKKTKEDLVELLDIPESKISVVYQGCDEAFNRTVTDNEKDEIRNKYNLHSPYILYVGSIEERKNLLLLLEAIKNIKKDISVVAVGRKTDYIKKINEYIEVNKLQNRVHLLHNIPFKELPAFYQTAELFVYPSFYEGFGIPLLEGLCSGIPVIGATGSCLEEAGGPHSLYTDPRDSHQLQELIESVLNNSQLKQSMIREGLLYAKKFTPSLIAENMMEIYRQMTH